MANLKADDVEISEKRDGDKIKIKMLHKPTGRWIEGFKTDDNHQQLTRQLEREVEFYRMGI